MLLRNYDNYMVTRQILRSTTGDSGYKPFNDTSAFGEGHINIKDYNGTIKVFAPATTTNGSNSGMTAFAYLMENVYSLNGGGSNLVVGSDDTPVTYDDYKLGSIIPTSQIKAVSQSVSTPKYNENTKSWDTTYSKRYVANSDITIKELGIVEYLWSSTGAAFALLYREVLSSPISVPANATVVVTFTMKVYDTPNKPVDYAATASVE
jgi:hypothetical protein